MRGSGAELELGKVIDGEGRHVISDGDGGAGTREGVAAGDGYRAACAGDVSEKSGQRHGLVYWGRK